MPTPDWLAEMLAGGPDPEPPVAPAEQIPAPAPVEEEIAPPVEAPVPPHEEEHVSVEEHDHDHSTEEDLRALIFDLSDRVRALEQYSLKFKSPSWRAEPIVVPRSGQPCKQFLVLTRLLRTKDRTQLKNQELAALANKVAVYDPRSRQWPELAHLNKGQASDLIQVLVKLPFASGPQIVELG